MTRDSNLYVTRRVRKCLAKIAEKIGLPLDELADGILTQSIQITHPKLWELYTRHDLEEKALLDTINNKQTP